MLARHVNAVLIILVANDTRIGVGPLADKRGLDGANIRLAGTNLEHCLVHYLEQQADLALVGESSPGAVGSAHVLNIKLVTDWGYGGVDIGQVLVLGEVQEVGLFAADSHLLVV